MFHLCIMCIFIGAKGNHTSLKNVLFRFFYSRRGMDDPCVNKNQYVLERMILWLINLLKLNVIRVSPSEKIDTLKKNQSPTRKKGICADLLPGKIYLEKKSLKKIIIKRPLGFLRPYSCMEKNGITQCRVGKLRLVRANDLNLINYYMLYLQLTRKVWHLAFIKLVSFNRHHWCDWKVGDTMSNTNRIVY